jgi:hypothetical protein
LGGRQGGSSSEILGKGRSGSRKRKARERNLEARLEKGTSKAVAVATFAAIAEVNPAVGILYAAYQVADYTYPIVREGALEYSKTGDSEKAMDKMRDETFRQTKRVVRDTAIDALTGVAVHGAMNSRGIATNPVVTTFVETAISETIKEVIS